MTSSGVVFRSVSFVLLVVQVLVPELLLVCLTASAHTHIDEAAWSLSFGTLT